MSLGEYIPTSNTKLLLHLNGNSTDSSGNSNNGTNTNITFSQANGKFGQGAGFGGNSKIAIPNLGISGSMARTVSVWIYFNSTVAQCIFTSGVQTSGAKFVIYLTGHSAGDIYVGSYGNDGYTAGGIISANIWTNIIVTYAGTGNLSNTTLKVYINTKLCPFLSFSNPNTTVVTANSNYQFGVDYNNTTYFLNGKLDDAIIENRAWTAQEVKKYYTNSIGRYATI